MFAQAACGKCGKLFQVPAARLGEAVACPWCRERVTAVARSEVVPEELPADAPVARPVARRTERAGVWPPVRSKRPWLAPVLVVVLSLFVMVVAFLGSRYYRGGVPGFVWERFESPDGACRVELPGGVSEADLPANPLSPITRPGKTFTASSTFTRVGGFVGWYELDARQILLARPQDVLAAERERRKAETGWSVEAESTSAKVSGFDALEVRYADGSARYVERYVFVSKGPRPRLYLFGVGGGGFDPDGASAKRVLTTFWFDETK